MNILNLYAGIGGNRKLWGDDHNITAVESDESIAAIYSEYFPEDTVIVADAHQYLLDNYKRFEMIWTSRPCITHSRSRYWSSKGGRYAPVYPDMGLYQEIIFLDNFYQGEWVAENIIPYYDLNKFLIQPDYQVGRHFIWTNLKLYKFDVDKGTRDHNSIGQNIYGFNLEGKKVNGRKDQVLRNCVDPEIGLHILNCALRKKSIKKNCVQQSLFNNAG